MFASQECKAQEYLGGFEALKRTGRTCSLDKQGSETFRATQNKDLNFTLDSIRQDVQHQ
jgi:hypothetical protein